jgi:acyl-CoA synthetase (AMP-forming)/AMP-acid ligase II
MDEEMAPADLVFVLEHLEFRRPNSTAVVKIDRGVRHYLVRALDRHAARAVR